MGLEPITEVSPVADVPVVEVVDLAAAAGFVLALEEAVDDREIDGMIFDGGQPDGRQRLLRQQDVDVGEQHLRKKGQARWFS